MGSNLSKLNIEKEIILGDYRQVIQKMRRGYNNGNIICRRISDFMARKELSFVHILRKNNGKTGSLANKGARHDIGWVLFPFHRS